ncbi:hypothetical protein Hanom_Chr09g00835981 [Helianthus anomalus]
MKATITYNWGLTAFDSYVLCLSFSYLHKLLPKRHKINLKHEHKYKDILYYSIKVR